METAVEVTGEISSFSIILLDASGQRTILYAPNVNAHLSDPVFPKEDIARSPWIFLNHLTDVSCVILDDLCEIVCAPNHHLAWNPGGSQIREGFAAPLVRDVLARTDILFLNAEEALEFFRASSVAEAAKKGADAGAGIVCITDGDRGASISDGRTILSSPAIGGVTVVDATGAGDAFAVGVTWAYRRGEILPRVLAAGMINAASVIGAVGAETGLLTETALIGRMGNTALAALSSALSP
jgi:sugar/nucleoside kinase (ribokinase family)